MSRKLIDLSGNVYWRLTVIKRAVNDKHNNTMWLCLCSCSNEVIVPGGSLKRGRTKSCGCLNTEKVTE